MSTKREKGNTLIDVVQACEGGTAIKIQTDVRAARCGGHEAREKKAKVAMARTSGESDGVQTFANEIAIVMETKVPVERCAAVEGIEGKRLVNGRVAEDGTRLAASEVGKRIAERAVAAGIGPIVVDRNGFKYHGRVKGLADGAREGGLKF